MPNKKADSFRAKKKVGESSKAERDTKTKKKAADIFGCCKRRIEIVGNILAPLVPIDDWEALK